MALFKFLGGPMVQVTSSANLLEFELTCQRLQESLGLPIDPFFVLERGLYEVDSSTGQLLVELPRDQNPEVLLAHLGPDYRVKRELLVIPERSLPTFHKGLWIYRSAPRPQQPVQSSLRKPVPPAPDRKAPYNEDMKLKQGCHFQNQLTGEIWVLDLESPVPTGPGWDDNVKLQNHLKLREQHIPTAIEEARLVGMLIAPIFNHVKRYRDQVYDALLNVSLSAAIRHALLDPRAPTSHDWRKPVYEASQREAVERFCARYECKFPPEQFSFGFGVREAYSWGMQWIGAYTWRRLMFESMAEHSEVGAYFLQRWNEAKEQL
jgi:hypothetical protein